MFSNWKPRWRHSDSHPGRLCTQNRFVVLAVAILLLAFGAVSFHNLPVEAYPDIADNYVTVITQWPGVPAEEVEQQ